MFVKHLSLSYFWSKPFLLSSWMLWSLFIINLLGTIYGYEWYWNQILYTLEHYPKWLVLYVPDSPTASLFFTLSLLYLLLDRIGFRYGMERKDTVFRNLIEALAVITSVKYGIWAVSMIVAGWLQGDTMVWQQWMLIVSHLGMAVEALLFARFFRIVIPFIGIAALWTLSNDYFDYREGIYPWLPKQLEDDLSAIEKFTIGLSFLSILSAFLLSKFSRLRKV